MELSQLAFDFQLCKMQTSFALVCLRVTSLARSPKWSEEKLEVEGVIV